MKESGIEVSLFVDPDLTQVEASARVGAQFIELHTGAYAEVFHQKQRATGSWSAWWWLPSGRIKWA